MISFRLHKRQRSAQVTFDTNQLEEKKKKKKKKKEKIMIIASSRNREMHITMIESSWIVYRKTLTMTRGASGKPKTLGKCTNTGERW